MDPIKEHYKNWIRDEVQDPEVQKAKEAFIAKHFGPAAGTPQRRGFALSPAWKLALTGCLALAVLVKIGAFETAPPSTTAERQPMIAQTEQAAAPAQAPAPEAVNPNAGKIQVKKLRSQVGSTVVYQKHFEDDVQVTVLWVFPKGA